MCRFFGPPFLRGQLQLRTGVRDRLLQMSAATIDRLMTEPRERVTGTRHRKGIGATVLRRSIPIRTFGDWKDPEPGYMERIWWPTAVARWPAASSIRWSDWSAG